MGCPYEMCRSDTQLHHTLIIALNSSCIKGNFILCLYFAQFLYLRRGAADGGTVVKVLRYKSEGRRFDWNFPLT
jgi:hypothetical protein